MKKTQIIEMLKNFKRTAVTFFSIVLFVSFGMASYLGLDWSRLSIADSFSGYFAEGGLQQFELSRASGFREADMACFEDIEEINDAEGRYEAYGFLETGEEKKQIRVYSVTERINTFTYLDGSMPAGVDGILVEKTFADANGIGIGDTVRFVPDGRIEYCLKNTELTVSGIVRTSEYTSVYSDTYGVDPLTGGMVNGIMYLDGAAFDPGVYPGYSSVLIKSGGLNGTELFTEDYNREADRLADVIREKLEPFFAGEYLSIKICSANPSYSFAKSLEEIFAQLRLPLAGLFVIVGALVCFFAVARNVFDQKKLIGTKKALGFYKGEIMISLLAFTLISTVIGSVFGTLFARFAIETVIVRSIQCDYPFNTIRYVFSIKGALLFALFEAVVMTGATYLASVSILRRSANSLLTGADAHTFGEKFYMKTRLFRRLSTLGKTIVNNIFSEPGRALSTVAGVMGITALIVSSVSLDDFIMSAFDKQMSEVTKYDTVVYVRPDDETTAHIEACLDEMGVVHVGVLSTYVTLITPDDQKILTSLIAADDDAAFLKLFDVHDGKEGISGLNGLYATAAYRKEYRSAPDDSITIADAYGREHEIIPSGYFDYFLVQPQLIVDRETYLAEFGGDFAANSILLDRGGRTIDEIGGQLSAYDGFINVSDYYEFSRESFDSFASVFSLVVGLYIILAVMMALIVIMNLVDMFIKEKKYELIVLRINGFSAKRVKAYIYIDTIILTLAGTLLGLVLGMFMGNVSLEAYQSAVLYLEGGISVKAGLVGIGLTFMLVFIVTVLSIRKIDRFKLSDINA